MTFLSPHEVAVLVEQCAYDVAHDAVNWPIARHGVVIGDIAWDSCECGQLVVAETRRFPSMEFPLEEVNHSAECGEPWIVVEYTLSLTRCVPVQDENGNPPSISALAVSAARNSLDMTNVRNAVRCCLDTRYNDNEVHAYEILGQTVTGPSGMCAGFDMVFQVGWTNDCGCA